MVHVEELADQLVERVPGLELDVHGEEEGGEEEDGAGQGYQLGRGELARGGVAGGLLVLAVAPWNVRKHGFPYDSAHFWKNNSNTLP